MSGTGRVVRGLILPLLFGWLLLGQLLANWVADMTTTDPRTLPACVAEDGPGRCFWDATKQGTGNGRSFWIDAHQVTHYIDAR